jgi:CheY-like chemotaxis protein
MTAPAILVADDDPLVRVMLVRVASEMASEVVEVESGAEAIRALTGRSFDVLITDLRMPGASGLEVLEACRAAQPACRMVLVSGYADDFAAAAASSAGATLLHKPFGASALRELLGSLLSPPKSHE